MHIHNEGIVSNRNMYMHSIVIVKMRILCLFFENNNVTHKIQKYRP